MADDGVTETAVEGVARAANYRTCHALELLHCRHAERAARGSGSARGSRRWAGGEPAVRTCCCIVWCSLTTTTEDRPPTVVRATHRFPGR